MRDPRIRSFDGCWPFDLSQHRRHGTRVVHFVQGRMTAEVERLERVVA